MAISADKALDAIWAKRTDVAQAYTSSWGDRVSTPEGKRAAIRDWMTYQPDYRDIDYKDPIAVAKAAGATSQELGGTGGPEGNDWWDRVNSWFDNQVAAGKKPSNEEVRARFKLELPTATDEQISKLFDWGLKYATTYGQRAPKELQMQYAAQLFKEPTTEQQALAEQKRQADIATSGYTTGPGGEKTPTLTREQFDAQQRQFYDQLRSQLSGPGNWVNYWKMFGAPGGTAPGNMAGLFSNPAAFGSMTPQPVQQIGGPGAGSAMPVPGAEMYAMGAPTAGQAAPGSMTAQVMPGGGAGGYDLASMLRNQSTAPAQQWGGGAPTAQQAAAGAPAAYNVPLGNSTQADQATQWNQMKQSLGTSTGNFLQNPTQMNARTYYNMLPSQRQGVESVWGQMYGYNPQDAWEQVRRSLPAGTAGTRTRWT